MNTKKQLGNNLIHRVGIKFKLALLLILVGVIPLILVGILAGHLGQSYFLKQASSELNGIRHIIKNELENYFGERFSDVKVLASNRAAVDSLKAFSEAFEEDGRKVGGPAWDRADELYGSWLTQYRNQYGYYDLFLITHDGDIVYTVAKEVDLGINLNTSRLKESGLGKLFQQAKKRITIQDFEPYSPSQYQQAAFFGAPIKQKGTLIGVVALQVPHDKINRITNERTGMGKTGEAYLVGRVGANSFYRSDRIVKEGNIGQEKSGKYVELALNGSTGIALKTGSIGGIELVSYAPLEIPDLNWAIMVTKGAEEIKQPIYDFQRTILFFSVILVLLLLIAATAISRAAIRPIQTLIEGSRFIEGGNLAIRIPVSSKDELGELTNSFNSMARSLQKGIAEQKQAEEALRRSQKMDAIGQLTGGIAHDFNNILAIIIGSLELLKHQVAGDEKALKWANNANKAAMRASDLTKQLLSFSRKQLQEVKLTNINNVIQSMDSLISRSITPEVEVENYLSNDLWLADIATGEFEDALLNLIINARDAMPNGGKLTIKTSNKVIDDAYAKKNTDVVPGEYVELAVSDTGSGISKEDIDRVFEPFYTTKPQGKGTGLGMSMVFGFIRRSKGYIKIYSELGVGTTIRCYLPRSSSTSEGQNAPVAGVSQLPRGQETILVVDDEEDLLEVAQQYLEELGYTVLTATSGCQALEMLGENSSIDLLFSDVVMPGGTNGHELADQAVANHPGIKVLLSSGYTEKVVSHNGQARYATNLLSKPYTQTELSQKVREILDDTV